MLAAMLDIKPVIIEIWHIEFTNLATYRAVRGAKGLQDGKHSSMVYTMQDMARKPCPTPTKYGSPRADFPKRRSAFAILY